MNVLGVGPLEILVILILGLLVLGPEGMIRAGKTAGKFLHQLYQSEFWKLTRSSRGVIEKYTRELALTGRMERIRDELSRLDMPEKQKRGQGSSPSINKKTRRTSDQGETESARKASSPEKKPEDSTLRNKIEQNQPSSGRSPSTINLPL